MGQHCGKESRATPTPTEARFLGIEAGATRTIAIFVDRSDRVIHRLEIKGINLRLVTDAELKQGLQPLHDRLPMPTAIGVGMAGAKEEGDIARIKGVLEELWPETPNRVTNDLEIALKAFEGGDGPSCNANTATQVLVLSGTGACCFGRSLAGKTARSGGWGHLLGDRGSGYEIGHALLRSVVTDYDHTGSWPRLGQAILRFLQLNRPEDLIDWAQAATKHEVAALAPIVFDGRRDNDPIAARIIEAAAAALARDGIACARRLATANEPVVFVLAGGNCRRQPEFADLIAGQLKREWPHAATAILEQEGAWGAVTLAKQACQEASERAVVKEGRPDAVDKDNGFNRREETVSSTWNPAYLSQSPTEMRNPRSMELDRLSIIDAIELMLEEESGVPAALLAHKDKIAWMVERITTAFRQGGRLIYVGAGTSGRLGVLDASECPPTFHAPPAQVQGIIAGGRDALWRSIEGAEDDPGQGAQAVATREVGANDVVVGIAASGRTPFVWGALREAKKRGATTCLLCFNPNLSVEAADEPDMIIAPDLGPEVLTGSTRLKAGTATKLALNLLTTLSMVQSGKVISNLMVDLNATNEKLRDRAIRILMELTGLPREDARERLEEADCSVRRAYERFSP